MTIALYGVYVALICSVFITTVMDSQALSVKTESLDESKFDATLHNTISVLN